ncbi:Os01g0840900, partial [Oryza sativa Japonica Group]
LLFLSLRKSQAGRRLGIGEEAAGARRERRRAAPRWRPTAAAAVGKHGGSPVKLCGGQRWVRGLMPATVAHAHEQSKGVGALGGGGVDDGGATADGPLRRARRAYHHQHRRAKRRCPSRFTGRRRRCRC